MAKALTKLESEFQAGLKKEVGLILPGSYMFKLDSSEWQGIPDQLILWEDRWAILELKRSANSPFQPNQEWYIDQFNKMSYSSVCYPENKEAVLHEIQQAFGTGRTSRNAKRK
jgi:hypothetical protein